MSVKYLLFLAIVISVSSLRDVKNIYQLKTIVEENDWVFLKVYSRDCGYCKQIQPVCIELEKANKNITFLGLVGPQQSEFTIKYKITIFPTLFLFHKHLDLPIIHHGPRDQQNLQIWIDYMTSFQLPKVSQVKRNPDVVYKGPRGNEYELVKVLALRDIYTAYAWEETQESPVLTLDGHNITKFTPEIQLEILKANARLHYFSESIWYNIHIKKMNAIIFVNHNSTKQLHPILNKEAKKNPTVVFCHIEPNHPEYTEILDYLSASMEPAIFGLIPARAGLFKLEKEMNQQNIHEFVEGLNAENLTIHKKSQKSDNPHVLTRNNEHLVEKLPKDVVLFLYDDNKPYTDKLFQLANYVIAYLQPNPNIHVFVCNPLKNDLTLEVPVDPLPMIIFFKNNMKQHHIYFGESEMNPQSVMSFIKENTTFDWVQPEQYGPEDDEEVENKVPDAKEEDAEL